MTSNPDRTDVTVEPAVPPDGVLQALDASPEATLLLDERGRIAWCSASFARLLGGSAVETRDESFGRFLLPPQGTWHAGDFLQALRQRRSFAGRLLLERFPAPGQNDSRDRCWMRAVLTPLPEDAEFAMLLQLGDVSHDVVRESVESERARLLEVRARCIQMLEQPVTLVERLDDVLRYLSSLPETTGVTRRGVFFTRSASEAKLVTRASVGLSVGMVDELVRMLELDVALDSRRPEPKQVQNMMSVERLGPQLGGDSGNQVPQGLVVVPCFSEAELMGMLCLLTVPMQSLDLHAQEMLWLVGESCGLAIAKDLVRQQWLEARKASEETMRVKTQFLANVTHELRTPLNGILGITALFDETELDAEQRDYLETIEQSGRALLGIVEQLLDFGRLDAKSVVLENRPFELSHLVEALRQLVRPIASEKNLALECALEERWRDVRLLGDEGRLRQVLVNLVGNAIKFTDEGSVALRVQAMDVIGTQRLRLRFHVEDTGIGIPQERRADIFESFVQIDGSSTRRAGGTGLGLAISKQLVDSMGGAITVESELGRGSRFTVELELERVS